MSKDLGVWTAEDCALVLIDYQNEMFEVIRSETSADLIEMHVRLLAKTARAFNVPIVLSTVGVELGFNGPTLTSIASELDGIEPIDRTSMNAFDDAAFSEAVEVTGRERLIIGGLQSSTTSTSVGTTLSSLSLRCRVRTTGPCGCRSGRFRLPDFAWTRRVPSQGRKDPAVRLLPVGHGDPRAARVLADLGAVLEPHETAHA